MYGGTSSPKDDGLTRAYREIVDIHRTRFDTTKPIWQEDTNVPKRTLEWKRDWKDLEAVENAFRRAEELNPSCERLEYYAPNTSRYDGFVFATMYRTKLSESDTFPRAGTLRTSSPSHYRDLTASNAFDDS